MKIDFEDGSFISLEILKDDINIIMCAKKDSRTTTMTSSVISKEQIKDIVLFLSDWLNKN